jgi:hypothetical protein
LQLLKGAGTSGTGGKSGTTKTKKPASPEDAYDTANERLIEKLKALSPGDAEKKANDTIKELEDIVRTKKAGMKKAA